VSGVGLVSHDFCAGQIRQEAGVWAWPRRQVRACFRFEHSDAHAQV